MGCSKPWVSQHICERGTDAQVSKTFRRSQLCSSRDGVLWGKGGRMGLCLCQKEEGPEWRIDVLRKSDTW